MKREEEERERECESARERDRERRRERVLYPRTHFCFGIDIHKEI